MRRIQHHLNLPGANWFASQSTFCMGPMSPAACHKVRATKIDPAASGGPVEGGNP